MLRNEYAGPLELRSMQSLSERVSSRTGYRLVGDLAWNWCLSHDQPQEHPTALWTDGAGGEVVAWAWLELPDGLMLQVDPAHPTLADEVLAWAEGVAPGVLNVDVCQTETVLVDALARRGYAPKDGPFMVCLGRSLATPPEKVELPPGYLLRGLDGPEDVERRAAVHRAAFGSTRVTGARHARMMRTWPYDPAFDLVVEAPDGDFAAYCQGWYDPANRTGEFEPVGTHPDHRRRGLSRAVCGAVLHAFAAAGGERAVVYARGDDAYPVPKRLYESMGFALQARTLTYTRPV